MVRCISSEKYIHFFPYKTNPLHKFLLDIKEWSKDIELFDEHRNLSQKGSMKMNKNRRLTYNIHKKEEGIKYKNLYKIDKVRNMKLK